MFVFLIAYRARGEHAFRRNEIIYMMENIHTYFGKHQLDYKIMIYEQHDTECITTRDIQNIKPEIHSIEFYDSQSKLWGDKVKNAFVYIKKIV